MALTVIGIGIFLMLSAYLFVPPRAQTEVIAHDALIFLSTTQIEDLNDPYAGIGGTLWTQGKITQQENTILQQVGEFEAKEDTATAELFIIAIIEQIVPANYQLEIKINGDPIYPRNETAAIVASRDKTDLLISKKAIVYGLLNATSSDLWGPSQVQLMVWHE